MATAAKKSVPPSKSAAKPAAKQPAKPATKAPPPEMELEPGEMKVSATLSEAKCKELGVAQAPTVTVVYNFGSDLDESAEMFGREVVHSAFVDSAVIALQARLRRAILASIQPNKAGATTPLPDDVQDLVGDWKPSASTGGRKKSPAEKLEGMLAKLSAEDRAALIAKLTGEE